MELRPPLYRDWIKNEYSARKDRNSAYSIRAFARSLGVNKTTLAEVLAGKRHFSKTIALKVADELSFTPRQTELFLHEIRIRASQTSFETIRDAVHPIEFLQLQDDQFKLISDWYYIGILTLAQLREHKADPRWIAKRLGISEQEAKGALAALKRLQLLEVKQGRLIRTSLPIKTTNHVPSPAIRKYHKQNLRLAEQSLEHTPVERRIFGAISVPVHPDDLKAADDLIQNFKLQMDQLTGKKSPTEVYTLAIQFFPITKQGVTSK